MEPVWLGAYLILGAAALMQSLLLALQTWEHRRYTRSCLDRLSDRQAQGHAVVVVPCKGLDADLAANLRALFAQDYDDYELRFVVEEADDPACAVIERLKAEHPGVACRLVVAGRARDCGQKVHNLRAATADLGPAVAFLAFVDSDAQPRPWWLRALLARIEDGRAGAATGYRWFRPLGNTLANLLVYAANCAVAVLLGRRSHYLIWGGSWAVRRQVFEDLQIRQAWQAGLSDDLLASRQFRLARRPVWFEPAAVVGSPLGCTLWEMFAFARRQYQMLRLYAPRWWWLGLLANGLANLAWGATLVAVGLGALRGGAALWLGAAMGAALYLVAVLRGYLRQDVALLHFPQLAKQLRLARWFDIWLSPLAGLLTAWGLLSSVLARSVHWRGFRYQLSRQGHVLRIDPPAPTHCAHTPAGSAAPAEKVPGTASK